MARRRIDLLSILSYFLLLFIALIVILHFVFGFQYVVILTDSMEPNINPNDIVITKPVDPDQLRVGDVVMYKITIGNATYRITHRIVEIRTEPDGDHYFVTKGDNREYSDPWRVYPEDIVGRVVLVIPKVGVIWPYIPLIVLFLLLLVIAMLGYELAVALLGGTLRKPKSRKADLLTRRRKKIKFHHYKRR